MCLYSHTHLSKTSTENGVLQNKNQNVSNKSLQLTQSQDKKGESLRSSNDEKGTEWDRKRRDLEN